MRPIFLAFALFVGTFGPGALSANAAGDPSVDALLAKSRAALGGDAILRLRSVHVRSNVEMVGIKGTQEQWLDLAAATYAESQNAGPLSGADGFDGHEVWQKDASGIVQVEGGIQARLQAIDQAYMNGYALWLPDHGGATVSSLGDRTLDGASYSVLRVTPRDGSPLEVWFDQRSLPRRVVAVFGPQTFTTTFDDYRAVDGALLPYHIHGDSDTGNSSDAKTISVEPNPADIAAHLVKPVSDAHDFSIEGGATSTTIPFELVDNHVYVNVKLNGKGPYRFVFDSGGANVVDPAVLKEIGGSGQGDLHGTGVGSVSESSQFAKVATLEVGAAKLTDQNFLVLPTRQGFGVAAGSPVDGLIGYEVLARFITTNDYEHRTVTLRLPTATQKESFGSPIPFEFTGNGTTPLIKGAINGVPADMSVDTGSRVSISIFRPFAQAHPSVVPSNLTPPGVNGFGVGGAALGRLGRVASLQLGPYTISNSIGDFSVQEKGAFADPYTAGNIGGAVWRRFSLTFDYPHQTLYLAPNASFSKPENFDRFGAFLVNREGKPTVFAVRESTPAASAGIVKGDVITAIDSRPTANMSLVEIRNAFTRPAGTRLRLTVQSGTASKPVDLTLRDYV